MCVQQKRGICIWCGEGVLMHQSQNSDSYHEVAAATFSRPHTHVQGRGAAAFACGGGANGLFGVTMARDGVELAPCSMAMGTRVPKAVGTPSLRELSTSEGREGYGNPSTPS